MTSLLPIEMNPSAFAHGVARHEKASEAELTRGILAVREENVPVVQYAWSTPSSLPSKDKNETKHQNHKDEVSTDSEAESSDVVTLVTHDSSNREPRLTLNSLDKGTGGSDYDCVTNKEYHGRFAKHLHDVLSQDQYPGIFWWNEKDGGRSFCLRQKEFTRSVMKQHFNGKKFNSFTRKLNRWGFFQVHGGLNNGVSTYKHKNFHKNAFPEIISLMTPRARFMERDRAKKMTKKHGNDQNLAMSTTDATHQQAPASLLKMRATLPAPVVAPSTSLMEHDLAASTLPAGVGGVGGRWNVPTPTSQLACVLQQIAMHSTTLSSETPLTAALALLEEQFRVTTCSQRAVPSLLTSPPLTLSTSSNPLRTSLTTSNRLGDSLGSAVALLEQHEQASLRRELRTLLENKRLMLAFPTL